MNNRFLEEKYLLKCPVCGFDYTHIDNHEPSTDDLSRNGGIIIKMWCENGCTFDIAIVEHKGQVFRKFINKKEYKQCIY